MTMTTDLVELIDKSNDCIRELESCMCFIADNLSDNQVRVRDLMGLIEEMNSLVSDLEETREELRSHRSISEVADIDEMLSDPDIKEYQAAYDKISAYKGEYLISDHYFVHHAVELAEDLGRVDRNGLWPHNHIDWEAAAEDLKQDYTRISIGSEDYYVRNC
jgi:antirestriction protein